MIDIRQQHDVCGDGSVNYNIKITEVLQELVKQIHLEQIIDGGKQHAFRLRCIKHAIKQIAVMSEIKSLQDLKSGKGIGNGIRRRVGEILKTGTLVEIQNVNEEVCAVYDLSKVHGIGPKLLAELYHSGIRSIDMLQRAIIDKSVGVKIHTPTMIALRYHDDLKKRIPRKLIDQLKIYLQDHIPADTKFEICGSYRRGVPTSGDIDILLQQSDSLHNLALLLDQLRADGFLVAQLARGLNKYNGICYFANRYCRIDFLLTNEKEYYPALLHFTGSGLFNQIIRWHANKQGYKLSNLGLTRRTGSQDGIPEFTCERDIFDFLGIRYLEPHIREL